MNDELLIPYQRLYSLEFQDKQNTLLPEKSIPDEIDSSPPLPNDDSIEVASFLRIQGGRNVTSPIN